MKTYITPSTIGKVCVLVDTGFSQTPELLPGAQVLEGDLATRFPVLAISLSTGVGTKSSVFSIHLGCTLAASLSGIFMIPRRPSSPTDSGRLHQTQSLGTMQRIARSVYRVDPKQVDGMTSRSALDERHWRFKSLFVAKKGLFA